jgi:hypothetical protein
MKATNLLLDRSRTVGDPTADALVADMASRGNMAQVYQAVTAASLDEVLAPEMRHFLSTKRALPTWYDALRVSRGQRFFERYAEPIMMLLGGLSLPYCYAATPGNQALYLSSKMRSNPGKRLADTAEFVLGVCRPQAFETNGQGVWHIQRTRLIHAIARFHLLKQGTWKEAWGVPINQEDMAGTNLAFGYLVLNGLQRTAYQLTSREREDFIFLWRVIGHQLHLPAPLLPASFREASVLEAAIRQRHFRYSPEGVELTNELLSFYERNAPAREAGLVRAQVFHWLGPEVAACVGLSGSDPKLATVPWLNAWREVGNYFAAPENGLSRVLQRQQAFRKLNSK